jgi:hypothetical protein
LFYSQVSAQTEEVVEEELLAEPMMVYKEDGQLSRLVNTVLFIIVLRHGVDMMYLIGRD